MSGNIRKQLGPVSKRLQERVDEAVMLLNDGETEKFKTVRTKLLANMNSHEAVVQKLESVGTLEEDEQTIVDLLLEKQVRLSMDAREMLQMLDDAMGGEYDDTNSKKLQKENLHIYA